MKDIGIAIGCTERGYNPQAFDYIRGSNQVWEKDGGPAARLLIKAARDVMIAAGRGRTAPAWHLHFLAKSSSWDTHVQEVAEDIARLLEVFEPMRKEAFVAHPLGAPALVEAGGLMGRGALLGAMGLGGGLGSLYWLLSRHSNQDSADMESMQNQVDYYHQLSREIEDSMRRKYRYERHQEQPNLAQTGIPS